MNRFTDKSSLGTMGIHRLITILFLYKTAEAISLFQLFLVPKLLKMLLFKEGEELPQGRLIEARLLLEQMHSII